MIEVIYMKAEYEPWWMFDGWEENILTRKPFKHVCEAKVYLESMLQDFRIHYEHEHIKKEGFYAFWTDREKEFCEACDDDLQIYHGVILLIEGKPSSL